MFRSKFPTEPESVAMSSSGFSHSNLINAILLSADENRYPKRKRCRRKHGKSNRKQNRRRRVRPGKSRQHRALYNMGAPLNNNEFLINQRNWNFDGETGKLMDGECCENEIPRLDDCCTPPFSVNVKLENRADFHQCPCTSMTTSPQRSCPCSPPRSHRTECEQESGETSDSDYGSLRSPGNLAGDVSELNSEFDCINLEVFDEEFARRNFEAEYTAQLHELRDELMQLSKRELEERCAMLMSQVKEIEQPVYLESGSMKEKDLRQELEDLKRENKLLREENHNLKLVGRLSAD